MEKKRPKVNINLESLFIGDEPVWNDPKEIPLSRALSWYSNQYGPKESKKYTLDFVKSNKYPKDTIEKLSMTQEDLFKNLGFVCRVIQRGYQSDMIWVNKRIDEITAHDPNDIQISQFASPKKENTIQDRIFDQVTTYISDIEEIIDNFIKTRKIIEFNTYEYLTAKLAKSVHAKQIIEHYKPMLDEINGAIKKQDPDLVEGYSGYKKMELNNFSKLIQAILDDCTKLIDNNKAIKIPRKKKTIPLEKKVATLKYKKEDKEFKIVSISPTEIIAAKQLWVFNTKYKTLGVYNSNDESGFSVKGTTIGNFDETTSIQKTLRKPLEIIPNVTKGKKSELKKLMNTINTKAQTLTGRLNEDTILLRSL